MADFPSPSTQERAPSRWVAAALSALDPQYLLPSLSAGLVTGIIAVIRAISYAALVFAGDLAVHLPVGIGLAIFGNIALSAVVALTGPFPGTIATPLAAPTAVLATLAGSIALHASEPAASPTVLVTVVAAIALGTLLSGLVLLALGVLRLGDRIQRIPYPVIGGFMAGTGWLLVTGSLQVMTGIQPSWEALPALLAPTVLPRWLLGAGFALVLLAVTARYKHFSVVPLSLLAFVAAFYAGLLGTGMPLEAARAQGWLLDLAFTGGVWQPLTPQALAAIDWGAVLQAWDGIASLVLICVLELVLTKNGIELAVGQDIDLDRTLSAVGLANVAAGLGSGMAGNQALPSTLLVAKMSASTRLTGLICALVSVAVLVVGATFLSVLPKPVLGALVLYLGLSLLIQWGYQTWFRLARAEYGVIVAMLVAIGVWGFLEGVALGFGLQVLIFLVAYSRQGAISGTSDGTTTQSSSTRSPAVQQWLQERGHHLHILHLRGYLFFGTANGLLAQFRSLATASEGQRPSLVVLDARRLEGTDATGVYNLARIRSLAQQHGITLVYTALAPELEAQLRRGGAIAADDPTCRCFECFDGGLAWCEERLLSEASLSVAS